MTSSRTTVIGLGLRLPVRAVAGLWLALHLSGCASLAPMVSEPELYGYVSSVTAQAEATAEPFDGVLTVESAVDRAVLTNQEIRAAMLQAAVAAAAVRVERGELLPDAVADLDYYRRDELPLSRSSRSTLYSTSSDLATLARNLDLSLNILDFGLTLVRMRQAGDKANQQAEVTETRKPVLNEHSQKAC